MGVMRVKTEQGDVVLDYDAVQWPTANGKRDHAYARDVALSLEEYGELKRRVTVTRLAMTGIFAFALKKKVDDRQLLLVLEAPDGRGGVFAVGKRDVIKARELVRAASAVAV